MSEHNDAEVQAPIASGFNMWDDERIFVVPGLPEGLTRPEGDLFLYPSSSVEFVKVMRTLDLPVEFATPRNEQTLVAHLAAEIWLPFLNIGIAVLSGAAGNLLATMVENALRKTDQDTVAHIDWKVKTKKGVVHRFKYDGPAKNAGRAARRFEKALRNSNDD